MGLPLMGPGLGTGGVVQSTQWFEAEPLTFPELLCLVSPLFYLILIDEPGGGTQGRVCWLLAYYCPKDILSPYSPHQFHDLQSQSSHIKEARIFDSPDVSSGPQVFPVLMCLSVDCENWKDPQITYDPTPSDIVEALESRDEDNSLTNGRTRTKSRASFSCLMTCTPL